MTCNNEHCKTLCDLDIGRVAVVSQITGDNAIKHRLLEMGLVPGTEVRMERKAPLNDPVSVYLRGYELSLRLGEARHVVLVSERSPHCGSCRACMA